MKKKLTIRNNKIEKDVEKNNEDINSFNIGIPKELLTKDLIFKHKYKYDGGELPTFLLEIKINIYFMMMKKMRILKLKKKIKLI